jgi:hypothetical protein
VGGFLVSLLHVAVLYLLLPIYKLPGFLKYLDRKPGIEFKSTVQNRSKNIGKPLLGIRKEGKIMEQQITKGLSDNNTYPQFCIQASIDFSLFDNFRQNPIYNQVLEHVTKDQGFEYLKCIDLDPEIMGSINEFKLNDNYGNPLTYQYPCIGMISPSTLRYIKVLYDIKSHFNSLDNLDICEIGIGYGGQCRIINSFFKPSTYLLVDIQPALSLAMRYLGNYILHSTIQCKTMNELYEKNYDLVISNYAFSELPRVIQDVYLEKIILKSKRGYITYNEINPIDYKSYKSNELIDIIPESKILKEKPLTHPKNCLIVWGTNM